MLVFWFFAMVIHFAWNGTSTFLFRYFFLLYAVIGVPPHRVGGRAHHHVPQGSREDPRRTRAYVRTGWFIPGEVTMATDRRARRAALKWGAIGRPRGKACHALLPHQSCLSGMDQRLMAKNGPDPARIEADRQMLAEAVDTGENSCA